MIREIALLFSILIFSTANIHGQTLTSSPGVLTLDFLTVSDDIDVAGVGFLDCDYGLTEVCIDISHNRVADLDIYWSQI